MVPNPTLQDGEHDGPPTPTGRVYITMKSVVTGTPHTFVKKYKATEGWMNLYYGSEDLSECYAFSKQGAKKIIERLKTRTYKENFEKGLIEFGTIDEYSY